MSENDKVSDVCYVKSPDVVSREIDDEVILVPIRKGVGDLESIYTFNEVGARIWNLLDGNHRVKDIVNQIDDEFDANTGQIQKDVHDFISQLSEIGAISAK